MSSRLLAIVFLLAFTGGYADAASYLLTKSFTGHLTGNTVFLMMHLAQTAWREAASNAAAIAAFLVGTGAAEWMDIRSGGSPARARDLRFPLLVEGLLLLVTAGYRLRSDDSPWGNDLCVVGLCLGLGWQNGTLRKYGATSVHTTFITGVSTSFLAAMLKGHGAGTSRSPADDTKPADGHPSKSPRSPQVLVGILLAFAVGAGTGGWLVSHSPVWGLTGLFLPLVVAMSVAVSDSGSG